MKQFQNDTNPRMRLNSNLVKCNLRLKRGNNGCEEAELTKCSKKVDSSKCLEKVTISASEKSLPPNNHIELCENVLFIPHTSGNNLDGYFMECKE